MNEETNTEEYIEFATINSGDRSYEDLINDRRRLKEIITNLMTDQGKLQNKIDHCKLYNEQIDDELSKLHELIPTEFPHIEDILTAALKYVTSTQYCLRKLERDLEKLQDRVSMYSTQIQQINIKITKHQETFTVHIPSIMAAISKCPNYIPGSFSISQEELRFSLQDIIMTPKNPRRNPSMGIHVGPIKLPKMKVAIVGKNGAVIMTPFEEEVAVPHTEYSPNSPHPHTVSTNVACLGEFLSPIQTALLDQDLIGAFYLVLGFLKTAHGEDSAGKYWPLFAARNYLPYVKFLEENQLSNSVENLMNYRENHPLSLFPDPDNIGAYVNSTDQATSVEEPSTAYVSRPTDTVAQLIETPTVRPSFRQLNEEHVFRPPEELRTPPLGTFVDDLESLIQTTPEQGEPQPAPRLEDVEPPLPEAHNTQNGEG